MILICTYHGITMHNDIAMASQCIMNLFHYVLLCLFILFDYVYYGITHLLVLCRAFELMKYPSTKTIDVFSLTDQTLTCYCYIIVGIGLKFLLCWMVFLKSLFCVCYANHLTLLVLTVKS